MVLTAEQEERIKQNRERALVLKKRKQAEKEMKREAQEASATKKAKVKEEDEAVELEAFEEGASEFVTKQDAMKLYCLPAGTLAVCAVTERPNPRNASWNPMQLYSRSEIRMRARKRFGGLAGLQSERLKRETKRFEKDMEKTKDIFR